MKRNLLKVTLALAMMPMGAWAAEHNFGSEEVVSTEKTWTFNGVTPTETVTTGVTVSDQLYNRSKTSGGGFTFTSITPALYSFKDGYTVNLQTVAHSTSGQNNKAMVEVTAGEAVSVSHTWDDNGTSRSGSNCCQPYFAFNVSVAGTCYAIMKCNDSKGAKIQFSDGSSVSDISTSSDQVTCIELACNGRGVFFIGTAGSKQLDIYAIRFVPTETKADKIVYIGATGYMTFSDAYKNYSTPTGLSAYGAKAANGGNAVELIPATNIKKQTGYILKGTPDTNYKLTELATNPTEPKDSELKRQASAKKFSVDGDGKDSENKYNYILAADGEEAKFFAVENETTLAVGKAWLQTTTQLTPAAGARGVDIIIGDETTGIETVQSSKVKDQSYYNLAGQRVAQPAKGLYIVNGKKIMIK